MVARTSSITNAFVNAVLPVVRPSTADIAEALALLGMDPNDVKCAYCGDRSTEWDHLRPLVLNRRPTGYISEIANLVPACGKCNQSKRNEHWRDWMLSKAGLSPTARGIPGTEERVARLEAYERWRPPTRIDFEAMVGREDWDHYWSLYTDVIAELKECQQVADVIKAKARKSLHQPSD
jgi:hypothetical protein